MLTSRAPLIMDFALVVSLLAPVLTLISVRLVRRRKHLIHRALQSWMAVVCFSAVIALEVTIRLAGGSGAFLAQANPDLRSSARVLLIVHAGVATLTYLTWAGLALRSRSRFGTQLPGEFSRTHRRLGWLVFSGLTFTGLSAVAMYLMIFVL